MEIKTPMVFVKHITAAQRGNATSIQYLCDHTSSQFVKICRGYDLSNNEIEAVLAKAYGLIFANIKSVKNPQTFMSWASGLVEECCEEIAQKKAPAERPAKPVAEKPVAAPAPVAETPAVEPAPVAAAPAVEPAPVAETPAVEPAPAAPMAGVPAAVAAIAAAASPAASAVAAPVVESAPITAAPVAAPAPVAETPAVEPAPVAETPVVRPAAPSAFYDENAYLEPATTFEDSITYADHSLTESAPVDKRVIPVDELVYHPEEAFMGSEETPAAPAAYVPPVHVEDEPDVDLREREVQVEKAPEPAETSYDEEDIDVSESDYDDEEDDEDEVQSGLAFRTKVLIGLLCVFIFGACVGIGYAISKGMAGNDIEMTSNSGNQPTPDAGAFASSGELIDETAAASVVIGGDTSNATDRPADDPNGSPDNTASDAQQTGNTASDAQQTGNTASDVQQTGNTASDVQQTGNTASDAQQAGNTASDAQKTNTASDAQQTDGTASTRPSANKSTGEVTARADLGTYVGETFASVFRDYPDLKRSVYRGELSYANDFVCFMGSYDATQPVSSTIVESVSLLTESKDFNINGFYIGMAAADAESLAVAGEYTEKEMSAESSREYLDPNGNILTLTIDSEVIKNAALRLASANEL